MTRPVTFLSDYGLQDEFVGVVHGVIARIAPEARVIDLGHGFGRHDVRRAALALRAALPFTPEGVHLVVVDPEVGAERRAIACAVATGERLLVGPDNGVLMLAAQALGGVVEAVEIGRSPVRLEPVSATFHGRDLFAPVAAHLANGTALSELGELLDPDELVALVLPTPERTADGALIAHALASDRFGNVQLDAGHGDLTASGLRLGRSVAIDAPAGPVTGMYAHTFADVAPGACVVYEDASRMLAVAINRGSAAEVLGLRPGDELRLRPGA